MVAPAVDGIDLFKIAGRSISGWIPSLKTNTVFPLRQPFCSQLEERLLLWLEYHPQVVSYARGDIGPAFAKTYRLPTPKDAPFAIGYTFEGKPHDYLPDAVGMLSNGTFFIAEAGMEDDKRGDRNLAKAEAARRLAHIRRGVFWIGTERTLTRQRHYNLVFLHARRKTFPTFAEIVLSVQEVWPWGEVASVEEIESRLVGRWPKDLVEAAIWKLVGDSLASGHLLIDLEQHTLNRHLPLALLPPDAIALPPPSLPETLLADVPVVEVATTLPEQSKSMVGSTVMPPPCRRNNGSSFSGICAQSSWCLLEPLKPAWRKRQGWRVQPSLVCSSGLAKKARLPVCLVGVTNERAPCIRPSRSVSGGSF